MTIRFIRSRAWARVVLIASLLWLINGNVSADSGGLRAGAAQELRDANLDKYLDKFTASKTEHGVWIRHAFDPMFTPDASYPAGVRPDGPVCVAGTDYSVFTREGDPEKLLIFLQGGGACWQGFYNCNILAEDQMPPEDGPFPGAFDSGSPDNPFADYSVVYMPYCDGSTYGGDNDVSDDDFPYGPTRFHRGLRNVSAGMDVAASMFPHAGRITLMGHSAGGVAVASFAPFLTRFVFGNDTRLTVYNDAGPLVVNPGTPPAAGGPDLPWLSLWARQHDWQFQRFYPRSCIDDGRCDAFAQQTGIIDWRLENDSSIREAFYETDSDRTNRFFAQGDGSYMDPQAYRDLILAEHGAINEAYPARYKRFIVSADDTHGAVQVTAPTPNFPFPQPDSFYTREANGVLLSEWAAHFVRDGQGVPSPEEPFAGRKSPTAEFARQVGNLNPLWDSAWKDIVEEYVPVPIQ